MRGVSRAASGLLQRARLSPHVKTRFIGSALQNQPPPSLPPAALSRHAREEAWPVDGRRGQRKSRPRVPAVTRRGSSDLQRRRRQRKGRVLPFYFLFPSSANLSRRDAEGRPEPHVPRGAPRQVRAAWTLFSLSLSPRPRVGRRRQRPFCHCGAGWRTAVGRGPGCFELGVGAWRGWERISAALAGRQGPAMRCLSAKALFNQLF